LLHVAQLNKYNANINPSKSKLYFIVYYLVSENSIFQLIFYDLPF
jgi:hypothetical protein